MNESIVKTTTEHMNRAVEGIHHEFLGIRTGKASPALIETLHVEAYGSKMPLIQLATISSPDPRLLLVQPWDRSLVGTISKAIQSSDLGLTPTNDSNVIRVPIPPLNEERRKELVRMVHKIAETGRISIRLTRKEANDRIKKEEKDGELAEDDSHKLMEEIQKQTDKFIAKIDELLKAKEVEIMEV
jgi:ribosome recycling factor